MKKITIIGFGRFGQTLFRLIKDDFEVTIFNRSPLSEAEKKQFTPTTKIAETLSLAYESQIIFFAVPILQFEKVIKEHRKYFQSHHVLIDVLSVKVYPKQIFTKYLKNIATQVLLTHPMFGPDSSKQGFENLPFIISKFRTTDQTYLFWKEYFERKKLRVVEMTAEMHDRYSANSLGVAQFVGRLLDAFELKPTPIDSLGAIKLQEIRQQACNDTWELFLGLQNYNPYTKHMRTKIGQAYKSVYNKLLPKQADPNAITFGIQGGRGSFNHEALNTYLTRKNIAKYNIKFLFTTEKVLKNLQEGTIDFGLFAISNSTGGLVEESIQAITKYPCKIVEDFPILIQHFLMKRKDVDKRDITTIMAHTQVFRQCEQTLKKTYPHLILTSGKGDVVDTAKAAEDLSKGKLSKNIAILGPEILAKQYDFDILASNMQDKKDNQTRFLLVSRQ